MGDIEITFIGSGDAFCSLGRANQSVWVKACGQNWLLDCGPTTLYRLKQLNLSPNLLDGVLFTHFHGDHFPGVIGLDLTLTLIYKRTMPIVYSGARGIRRQFEKVYQVCYPTFYPNQKFARQFKTLSPNRTSRLAPRIRVTAVPMRHTAESLGYLLHLGNHKIAITGDTGWCDGVAELAAQAELLICECVFYKKPARDFGHLSYEELVGKIPPSCQLILTHTSEEIVAHRQEIACPIAEDGLKLLL